MNNKQNLIKILSDILILPNLQTVSTKENQIESAVAVILKNTNTAIPQSNTKFEILEEQINYLLQTQILFLQRVTDNKRYSGDVCFPGGKVDKGQSPLQASIRQTEEETSIQLKQRQLLGVANKRFLAYQRSNVQLYAYAFVFFIQRQVDIKLNLVQMTDFKWIPLKHFLQTAVYKPMQINHSPIINRLGYEGFQKYISHIQWPSVQVGLSKNLYGLTFYMLAYFTNELINSIIRQYTKLCKIQTKIIESSYQIEQSKRHIFFRTKILFQECLISAMRLKNFYFNEWKLIFKENCPYSQARKSRVYNAFLFFLAHVFDDLGIQVYKLKLISKISQMNVTYNIFYIISSVLLNHAQNFAKKNSLLPHIWQTIKADQFRCAGTAILILKKITLKVSLINANFYNNGYFE